MPDRLIPVIADSVKSFGDSRLLRCTYFYVAIDETELVWVVGTEGIRGASFMVGGAPVLSVEAASAEALATPRDIEALFASIEEHDHQTVETGPLWVPYDVITDGTNHAVRRGDVLNLTVPLFHSAFLYGQGTWSHARLEETWREHRQDLGRAMSEQHRAAWGGWMQRQIEASRSRHHAAVKGTFLERKSEA